MTDTDVRVARRIAAYMLSVSEQQIDLHFFMGLGMGLAVVYEETQGKSAANIKPQELLQWAKNLPDVKYPHVSLT